MNAKDALTLASTARWDNIISKIRSAAMCTDKSVQFECNDLTRQEINKLLDLGYTIEDWKEYYTTWCTVRWSDPK